MLSAVETGGLADSYGLYCSMHIFRAVHRGQAACGERDMMLRQLLV